MDSLMKWFPESVHWRAAHTWVVIVLLGLLLLVPAYSAWAKEPFYLTLFGRIMIFALVATSLNLLIGYAGLVSLGHAMFMMIGAYGVGLLNFHGITNGWLQWFAGLAASGLIAIITGSISLRTTGMAFIMITLAFAQMIYFLGVSLKQYGGDDGMRLDARSQLWPLDLSSAYHLYFLILALLLICLFLLWRLAHSRYGYTLRAIKSNERRVKALGLNTHRFKLSAYVLAALVASTGGFLLSNLTSYVSPAFGSWTVSGELIVMVIMGGVGTVFGGVVGAMGLLLLEEALQALTEHWQLFLGLIIIAIVLVAKQGLYGSLRLRSLSAKASRSD
jgi:branched-chain amino acid transport system permease protein